MTGVRSAHLQAAPPDDVLRAIVERTRASLADDRAPLQELERAAAEARSGVMPHRFRRALAARGAVPSLIAEVKAASPSAGAISPNPDVERIACAYRDGGAAAISVVTEPHFFLGSAGWLARARSSGLPVLMKDFILGPRQLLRGIAAGADAVLLLASILDAAALRTLRELLRSYGCDALVEVHDEEELERALESGAEIIGINNRDLRTFRVDLETSERLAAGIPRGVILVSESGIRGAADAARLDRAGFHALLVGEHLLRQTDPVAAVRELARGPVAVKICGITRLEDALAAATAGADFVGFVFAEDSPRNIAPGRAREIAAELRRRHPRVRSVGVFRDAAPDDVERIATEVGVDLVQLHGNESELLVERSARPVIRAIPVAAQRPEVRTAAEWVLFDGGRGGEGRAFDWSLTEGIRYPARIALAGGLTPENVREAVRRVRPEAVDVSSGVETAAGIKSAERIRAFIEEARRQWPDSPESGLWRARPRRTQPDRLGHFGEFGGKYVPETLMAPLDELERAFRGARRDPSFKRTLGDLLATYVGRPTALTEAPSFAARCGAFRLFLKREDLTHTGAHKINNALGQALLAKRMGKERIIAETGAGQHGVATATACALLGLSCRVYMGEVDMARQELNVFRMRLLGAEVVPVASGSRTLKDAINEAIRDWVTNVATTHYIIGSALGPHPYPLMVRTFQSVIGREASLQIRKRAGRLPDLAVACVGGGSNAIGLFHPLLRSKARLVGVEAGGRGPALGDHAARFAGGLPGVLHGTRSMVLQDGDGQIAGTHSISAGLDYPSVGPEHAHLASLGRIEYATCSDEKALEAFRTLSVSEGIIPALESAHALGWLLEHGPSIPRDSLVLLNLSGRGDKDVPQVAAMDQEGKA